MLTIDQRKQLNEYKCVYVLYKNEEFRIEELKDPRKYRSDSYKITHKNSGEFDYAVNEAFFWEVADKLLEDDDYQGN